MGGFLPEPESGASLSKQKTWRIFLLRQISPDLAQARMGRMTKPRISAKSVFAEAVVLAAEERAAFLDKVCRTAPKIRLRVEAMLAHHDQHGSAAAGSAKAGSAAAHSANGAETQAGTTATLTEIAAAGSAGGEIPHISAEELKAATEPWFVPVEVESWREEITEGSAEGQGAQKEPFFVAAEAESWREDQAQEPEGAATVAAAQTNGNGAIERTTAPGTTGAGMAVQEDAPGAGTRLGRYSIVEPLGSRELGVAYRAVDEKLNRTVVIKMLAPGVVKGEEARRKFKREATALAQLNHPNIAAVYEAGEQDGQDYVVLEWVEGESLAAKLSKGALDSRAATAILMDVAQALVEAHDHGVLHRDLKPANVVITAKGNAKVLDFGMAKLLTGSDSALLEMETQGLAGTQEYMSPEQVLGEALDERSDLWSLGVVYYACLTGRTPFKASNNQAVVRAITDGEIRPAREVHPEVPEDAEEIAARALERDPDQRYQEATEMVRDAWNLLKALGDAGLAAERRRKLRRRGLQAVAALLVLAASTWLFRWNAKRQWAREQAIPEVQNLLREHRPLAAWLVLKRAQGILPADANLAGVATENTEAVTVNSDPAGALVEIQDYLTPGGDWRALGTTPLTGVRIPKGYFRWRLSKDGLGTVTAAPETAEAMSFSLTEARKAPGDMVYDPGGTWAMNDAVLGKLGPFNLPAAYIDRYEVTNVEYQAFVDRGGYATRAYWPAAFQQNGRTVAWSEAMAQFHDTTGRPGPSTWVGGHFPTGKADFPVSGVSWYEAAAYAAFAGKALPAVGQWYQADPPSVADYTVLLSNMGSDGPDAVGTYRGVGPYGTYDMAGNVREWLANSAEDDLRVVAGGSWKSPREATGLAAISAYDRSDVNGFRCVRNLTPLPEDAGRPVRLGGRGLRSGR
jgi:formylglycine-generating enzyme required for sulfatase activity